MADRRFFLRLVVFSVRRGSLYFLVCPAFTATQDYPSWDIALIGSLSALIRLENPLFPRTVFIRIFAGQTQLYTTEFPVHHGSNRENQK